MNRKIEFYKTKDGFCPVLDFLDSLPGKAAQKVTWTLRLIKNIEKVPITYLKKLSGRKEDIWEIRTILGSNTYRLLCFWDNDSLIIVTHGFIKKTNKIPAKQIETAIRYKNEYFRRTK